MASFTTSQTYTVPATGIYTIVATGARGGNDYYTVSYGGGAGARISGNFSLTAGQAIAMTMGVIGDTSNPAGGGTGTIVKRSGTVIMVAAGGGGGARCNIHGYVHNGTPGHTTGGTAASTGNGLRGYAQGDSQCFADHGGWSYTAPEATDWTGTNVAGAGSVSITLYVPPAPLGPNLKANIDGVAKSWSKGWVNIDGSLKTIDSMWTNVSGVLKKL